MNHDWMWIGGGIVVAVVVVAGLFAKPVFRAYNRIMGALKDIKEGPV